MKRIGALILIIITAFSLCSCRENTLLQSSYYSDIVTFIVSAPSGDDEETPSGAESSSSDSSASKDIALQTPSENPNTPNTPPITPPVTPATNQNNDTVADYNNNLNNTIEKELGSSESLSEDEYLNRVWSLVAQSDGVVFSSSPSAKDTDTLSMINLYNEPMCPTMRDVEIKILNALNKSAADSINTGIIRNAKTEADFMAFATDFYMYHGYCLSYGFGDKDGYITDGEEYIWIAMENVIQNKKELEDSKEYKYIQQAIKECNLRKGMLQKDAISNINRYICGKVAYDYDSYSHDLLSFFEKGDAICNSYSQVFELICRTVGIDASYVAGELSDGGGGHAWNVVKFSDGSKYYFDICWNDCPVIADGKSYYNYDRFMFATACTKRTMSWAKPVAYMKFN